MVRALSILALLFVLFVSPAGAQGPYSGLTIISLRTTTDSYLIDLDLGVVKTWHGTEVPTELAYMLPDSSIIRPCRVPDVDGRGGRWGHGGDLLYRWGNPQVYGRGDESDQVIWGAHGAIWIDEGLPGAGNIMVFNNGDHPGVMDDFSSVEEILPPQSEPGVYTIDPGQPFGPADAEWRYGDVSGFFSATLGGAYRLPNNNTLICEGTAGRVFEVNPDGTVVWVFLGGAPIHRAPRYWGPVSAAFDRPPAARLVGNHPNPFNPTTTIAFAVENEQWVTISVFNIDGRRIATVANQTYAPGFHSVKWTGRDDGGRIVPSGTYLVQMDTGDGAQARKISLVR